MFYICFMESIINLRNFMKDPIQFLDERFAIAPKSRLQELNLGHKRFVLVFDPTLAKDILITRSEVFIQNRTIFDRIKPITGEFGLVQLNGSKSAKTRDRFAALFAPANMLKMKKQIQANSEETLKGLAFQDVVDISLLMADLVLQNAFQLFLGLDIKVDAQNMAREFQELNALCGQRMIAPLSLPLMLPTYKNRRIKFLQKSLRTQIGDALQKTRNESITVASLFHDDASLIDQCMTFLFAGHETTASSLSFTFLLLGQHPEYRQAIAAGDEGVALRVYKEALRLYPPAYMLAREALIACELGGLKIRKGTQILIGVKQLHYHPSFHQEAAVFNPDRFKSSVEAFLPFGGGPKACIGESLAYMEAVTIINAFCRKFDFVSQSENITSYPLVTLHPGSDQLITLRGRDG